MFSNLFTSLGSLFSSENLPNIISTGFNVYSQLQAARAQESDFEFQADILRNRARSEQLQAREEALKLRKQVQADIGRAQAMFAKRGVMLGAGGTPQRAFEQSLIEQEEDIDTLLFGARERSSALSSRASFRQARGASARALGFASAGQSLLRGFQALDFGDSNRNL